MKKPDPKAGDENACHAQSPRSQNGHALDDKPFPETPVTSHAFQRTRDRTADKLKYCSLRRFRLYDLRRYFATMLYQRTKDILYVKEQLGHRRLENTLTYTHLVNWGSCQYTVKVGKATDEAAKLLESGFEYVATTPEGIMLFRKPIDRTRMSS